MYITPGSPTLPVDPSYPFATLLHEAPGLGVICVTVSPHRLFLSKNTTPSSYTPANTTIQKFTQSTGVTHAAVHHVLNEKKSKKLSGAIDFFITAQFSKHEFQNCQRPQSGIDIK